MPKRKTRSSSPSGLPVWKLEDAKARFSELVRRARESGPQRVTVRGREAVVVLSAADYARLAPATAKSSLAELFGEGPFAALENFDEHLIRERPPVRDIPSF
jgi:antitoxin Phd